MFRKKSVYVVEAMQWLGDNFDDVADFVGNEAGLVCVGGRLLLMTLGEEIVAEQCDWVIKNNQYNFSVMSIEDFERNFDVAYRFDAGF